MTLQSSGTITIAQINSEFGRGNNLNAYRGTGWYTDAGGSGTFSTGAISLSDFYGKRLTSPTFSFSISSSQTNANLRTLAVNAGWNQSSAVIATINSGVVVSANSTGSVGLTIDGSFPGGVTLVNNGYITGMGGAGGYGGSAIGQATNDNIGQVGYAGGKALAVATGVTIQNNGVIGGGGGGGGGASICSVGWDPKYGDTFGGGGGGGGGRSGGTNASGGVGGSFYGQSGAAGGAGTLSTGGTGGNSASASYKGGNGGSWGASGGAGTSNVRSSVGGGAAGACLTGNGYINWTATGSRYGAIS